MSETKTRTIAELQQEYANLCAKAGELQYKVTSHKGDLELINKQIRDINVEAAELNKAAAVVPTVTEVASPAAPEGAANV